MTGLITRKENESCQPCVTSKLTRASHPSRSTQIADENTFILNIDTYGPFRSPSLGGSRYFVLCVESFSNYKIVEFAGDKSEIPDLVKRIINQVELESGRPVRSIVTDNGSEYVNALDCFLSNRGIMHQRSAPYTNEQNGMAERANRSILDSARRLISDSELPRTLWVEAVNCAVYTANYLLAPNKNKTRFELYWKAKPDVRHLRVFGQPAIVLLNKNKRESKWCP